MLNFLVAFTLIALYILNPKLLALHMYLYDGHYHVLLSCMDACGTGSDGMYPSACPVVAE